MQLETPRLLIRPFGPEDEAVVVELFTDDRFMEWSMRGSRTPEVACRFLQEYIDDQAALGFSKYAVIDKEIDQVVGYSGFAVMQIEGAGMTEFGYRLAPQARGKGLATEAGRAVIEDAFSRLDMPYIQSIVNAGNAASRHVLDKLGFVHQRNIDVDEREWLLYRLERAG